MKEKPENKIKSKIGRNPFQVKKPKGMPNFQSSLNPEAFIDSAFDRIPYQTVERIVWGACFTYAVWNKITGKDSKELNKN